MRKSSEDGYSLIEVLIGVLIFSIGALASGMMIVASLHQNQQARQKSTVAALVSQRLEELRSRPWFAQAGDSLASGGAVLDVSSLRSYSAGALPNGYSETYRPDLSGQALVSSQEPFFIVMWLIEDLTDSGLDFKRITICGVAMNWHTSAGRWEPKASFDHVAMIFREIKAQ